MHIKCRFRVDIRDRPAPVDTKPLDRRPAAARQYPFEIGVAPIRHDQPIARHGANQMMKLRFDCSEIGKNIRVIKFQIVQHRGARAVMDKLGTLVEKRGVVFVGFNHKKWAIRKARGDAEILRNATDQKSRIELRIFEYPRQHRRSGGFAVRAGHRQHPFATQHIFCQPLWPGGVGEVALKYCFDQRIAAGDDIADHKNIRIQIQLRCVPAFDQLDPERAQLIGHGRIDIGVAAGDAMPRSTRNGGNATHEGAANAQNMKMHGNG